MPHQGRPGGCGISLVEHEIDHTQHGIQPVRELCLRRDLIRNVRVADLGLRPDDALRERGRGGEKRPRDFLRGQAAHFAQRKSHLRIGRQRRMATGEDQAQPVVFDALRIRQGRGIDSRDVGVVTPLIELVETLAAADAVDRFESSGRYEPGARICRHSVARPLFERRPEGVMQRLFGHVEVAEKPDQRGEHLAGVGLIDGVYRLMYWIGSLHGPRSHHLHPASARREALEQPTPSGTLDTSLSRAWRRAEGSGP